MRAYRAVLGLPGAARFSATALVARLPSSMAALGIVLLVHERTGSYEQAGIVSASYVLALAACAPLHGRLADRWGQARVLWAAGTGFAAGVVLLLLAIESSLPAPGPHLAAALAGAATPQAGALVRARWTHVLRERRDRLDTAFALEAVLDEVVFIVGPVLVTFLTLSLAPLAGLGLAGAAGSLGAWGLAVQRTTEPPPQPRRVDVRVPLGWRTLGPVMVAAVGLGTMFGSMEVVVVAFATEQGLREWSGAVLAVWAAGSLVAGVLVGALPGAVDPVARLRWTTVVLAALFVPLFLAPDLVWFTAGMFLAGFMIAPTLIAAMSVIAVHVHPARLTEGMAWTTTSLSSGVALGAAVVGIVVDDAGARVGITVPLVAAAVAAVVALTFRPGDPADRDLVPRPLTH